MRALFILISAIYFIPIIGFSQAQKGKTINTSYHNLTVKHSLQIASGSPTVFSKVTNTNQESISVVYSIFFRGGGGSKTLVATLEPGTMHNENLGNVVSFIISAVKLPVDRQVDRNWIIENSITTETVTVEKDVLISLLFNKEKFEKPLINKLPDNEISESISNQQTREILSIFFDQKKVNELEIQDEDKKVAKKFLKVLLEKSCEMSIPAAINPYAMFNTSLRDLIKGILKSYLKNCPSTLNDKYYLAVEFVLSWKNKGAFDVRHQTGSWDNSIDLTGF